MDWPEDAGNIFIETLRDRGAKEADRILAAGLAGELPGKDEKIAEALLSVVRRRSAGGTAGQNSISLGPVLKEADIEGFEDELSEPPIG